MSNITITDLMAYYDRMVTPSSLAVFSKIVNIRDYGLYRRVIDALYYSEIDLVTLANIPEFTDATVDAVLGLNDFSMKNPITDYKFDNAHREIMGDVDAPSNVGKYMRGFNNSLTSMLVNEEERTRIEIDAKYVVTGRNGEPYYSYEAFKSFFASKVIDPYRAEHGEPSAFLGTPPVMDTGMLAMDQLLSLSINTVLEPFANYLTNDTFNGITVWTRNQSCVLVDDSSMANHLINIYEYEPEVRLIFQNFLNFYAREMEPSKVNLGTVYENFFNETITTISGFTNFSVILSILKFLLAVLDDAQQENIGFIDKLKFKASVEAYEEYLGQVATRLRTLYRLTNENI